MKRALPVLLLLLAACGGGSEEKGADTSAKDAYLAEAEAICAKGNSALAEVRKKQPTAVDLVPAYVHSIVEIARTNLTELSALAPPPDDAADVEAKVLTPLREQLADGDKYDMDVAAAAKKKDTAALFQLVTNPPLKTKADVPWMKSYGFEQCATSADTGANAPK
ncbi:MAG: hypothetical protein JWN77_1124 [Frankiales bacterium]|jgi:hypothetical protein|nr:hypothetical protein [Frankiales bacterium]